MSIIKIGFGGSCHWCTEAIFQSLIGVKEVKQGWISSVDENESFSEAVIVSFNPDEISLTVLIEIHLHTHSCTANHSMREKYRSAIYYFNDEQQQQAQHTINALKAEGLNIVTELSPAPQFYPAEEYHQNFFARNPAQGYCNFTIPPKLMKLRSKFQDLLKPE